MAGEHTFMIDLHGLDEDLKAVVDKYPDQTSAFLRKEASRWKKDCNDAGYGKYTGQSVDYMTGYGKRQKEIKPIGKMWKNVKEENILHQVNEIQIKNCSRIFHLLENGHVKWIRGKNSGGFVPGKHWAEKTRAKWRDTFGDDVRAYLDKMLRGRNL